LLDDAAESAIHLGLTIAARIAEAIKGRPGTRELYELMGDRGDGRARQRVLEGRFWRLLKAAGIKGFVRQHEVRTAGERYFIDAANPKLKLAVELDGLGKRTNRANTVAEYKRQRELTKAGWIVVRFTWDDVVQYPEQVVADLLELITTAEAAG
jgi:very-short-patch-repair endonuclease